MREIVIASLVGVGWLGVSYAVEPLFPIGDCRWVVLAVLAFGAAGWIWRRRPKVPEPASDDTMDIWRASPGAGRNAAKAIEEAPTLDDARQIWDAFRVAPRRYDMNRAYWAFISRLENAGCGDEIPDLIASLYEDGEDIDPPTEMEVNIEPERDDDG